MKYFTTLDGETVPVELTADGVRIGGEEREAEVAAVPGGAVRHLRLGERGFRFTAHPREGGWTVEIGGRRFQVEVEDERAHRIREMTGGGPAARGASEVRAPMPGLVVRVEVEPGEEVEPGTGLLVMEAMKMENELKAERAGTVASVDVAEGETVEQGALLVTIE